MATVFHHNYVRHFTAGVTEHRSIIGQGVNETCKVRCGSGSDQQLGFTGLLLLWCTVVDDRCSNKHFNTSVYFNIHPSCLCVQSCYLSQGHETNKSRSLHCKYFSNINKQLDFKVLLLLLCSVVDDRRSNKHFNSIVYFDIHPSCL